MQSGSGVDLFSGFNEDEVSEVLRRCAGCGRFVLIGPPRSGKTFFKEKYLKDRLGAGVAVDEYTLGISTTAKTEREEAKESSGILGKVMKYIEGMIPLIKRLRDKASVEDEELRRVLGDEAPRLVVEGVKRSIVDSSYRAYYIPWDSNEVRKCVEEPNACAFGADVGKALKLIKEAFGDRRIRWFRAEYVPPGLVEEVIDLIRIKGEDGAREELKGWVEAYSKAIDILHRFLGLGDDLFMWDELATSFLSNFVNNYASYVIGGLATALMDAATLALVSVLTYIAFKKEGEGYLKEIIELKRSLEKLRRSDGEFNELGKLLVYRVAYAMGMSYDEAKEALMDITGLSIDELKRRVNEIERRIKEIEKKIELFRQEVPAGIVTADVNEFAKGRTYPNIQVENGELRIRVEDRYHSIVRAGKFNELVNEVRYRLLKQGFVVVVGPKGIGKSTLAATVIWELFMNSDIGLVARVDVLDSMNYSKFVTFVENYGKKFGKYFGRLLILYDPVSTEAYERVDIDVKAPIQTNIERTINDLMKAIKLISSEASKPLTLIVIPSDVYNALSGEVKNALEGYRLDVSQELINTEFLAELIREYSKTRDKPNGCALSDDVLSKLAGELAKFDSGHALIARLVGEELARSNCGVGKVEELINSAKGKAETFIILHINGLFKVHENPDTAKALVEIFALRRPFISAVKPGDPIPDTGKFLVKVYVLRSPFISAVKPGDPILTPGIVELIGEARGVKILYGAEGEELRSWLAIWQHDLIEETIRKLLDCIEGKGEGCKVLGDELKPWKTTGVIESLRKVSQKVNDVDSAVEYFARNYGERLTSALKDFSNECWKRAAYIIGHALARDPLLPRRKYLSAFMSMNLSKTGIKSPSDALSRLGANGDKNPQRMILAKYYASIVESLGDALKECGVDNYLIVGDKIPSLMMGLIGNHACALAGVFIDKYNEAIAEIKRLHNIIKNRGELYYEEAYYGLGLATIIAKATESGMPVGHSDADAALHIASFAMSHVQSTHHIIRILTALAPLRDKTPQRYLEVLVCALGKFTGLGTCHDWDTVINILNELDYILNKYGVEVKGHARTLVDVINTLTHSLYKCLERCVYYWFEHNWFEHRVASFRAKFERMISELADLRDKTDRWSPNLGIIAAYALLSASDNKNKNKCVRMLIESELGIGVVNKTKEVAGELSELRGSVRELLGDEDLMGFVRSRLAETDEKAAKRGILEVTSILKHTLAQYKFVNDKLDEAGRLFNEAAEESKEIGDYLNYLDNRNWALRVEAIKSPLAGDDLVKLVNWFRQLYEEALNAERFMSASPDYGTLWKNILRDILGGYLVSLALTGGDEEIRRIEELLKEQWQLLKYEPRPILTRLTLNALLSPRVELSSELRDRLVVKPEELIVAFGPGYIDIDYLSALKATYGTIKPGDEKRLCEEINDPITHDLCVRVVSGDYSEEWNQQAEGNLRQALIDYFQRWISKGEVLDLLKKLGLNAESLNDELRRLIYELSDRHLLSVERYSHSFKHEQLYCSSVHLTFMLYALVNGNEKLAKVHALMGAMNYSGKLPARLFLEAYRACCDPNNEEFRRAIAKLFFYTRLALKSKTSGFWSASLSS